MLLFYFKKKNAVSFDSYSLDPGLPGHADKPTNAAEARLQSFVATSSGDSNIEQ